MLALELVQIYFFIRLPLEKHQGSKLFETIFVKASFPFTPEAVAVSWSKSIGLFLY